MNYKNESEDARLLESLLSSESIVNDSPLAVSCSSNQDPTVETSSSVIETLKAFQNENPQIETVFASSDDEDDIKPTTTPRNTEGSSTESETETINMSVKEPIIQINEETMPIDSTFQAKPITVEDLPRINLPPSAVNLKTSNVINISDRNNPQSIKYLVIPADVLPLFAQSKGAVSIEIPGVGPVLLPKPEEFCKAAGYNNNTSFVQKPKPPIQLPKKQHAPKPASKLDLLSDPAFQCWKYIRNRKRDLEGFTLNDRMGFNNTEVNRTRVCVDTMNLLVRKLEISLQKSKSQLTSLVGNHYEPNKDPLAVRVKGKKPGKGRKRKQTASKTKAKSISQVQKNNLTNILNWKKHFTESSKEKKSSNFGSSSEGEERVSVKRGTCHKIKIERGSIRKAIESDIDGAAIVIKRGRGRPRKNHMQTPKIEDLLERRQSRKRGRRKAVSPNPLQEKHPEEAPECLEIMTTLSGLQEAIDRWKPILVVNDQKQWDSSNIEELTLNNNIVYPLKTFHGLPLSVKSKALQYKVTFVKPDILCRYLSGERSD